MTRKRLRKRRLSSPYGRGPHDVAVRRFIAPCLAIALLAAPGAAANTSHAGWPPITGMLLMNKTDSSRPLDARPGHDPFDGADPSYSCDAVHKRGRCQAFIVPCAISDVVAGTCGLGELVVAPVAVHNELLGGHGNDTIYAGPNGDVIWGDYKPSGQPTTQVDRLYGGSGADFVYASHGTNEIYTGTGGDTVHAHFGRGEIHCGSPSAVVYLSRRSRPGYKLFGCAHVSFRTSGH
jgi:Ca2+-binding RTX toxin-like protein